MIPSNLTVERAVSLVAIAFFVLLPVGHAQTSVPVDLSQANLEQLMDMKVTSVSKREQKLSQTAAAIFVITQEDIRRSGATNIPDLLRVAPGVDVEQINASSWAISVRGFNSGLSNKVLVLIDGRSVYSPTFSGVYWDAVDMPLEDIDRIEIIRGPGSTVWGANAVNGVISIISKHSKDTKGGIVVAGGGSQVKTSEMLQYGADAGHAGSYRAFGSYSDTGNSAMPNGAGADDRWSRAHAGFRTDWSVSPNDSVTAQGSLLATEERRVRSTDLLITPSGSVIHEDVDEYAADLSAQWTHTLRGGSQTSLLVYYDVARRTDFGVRNNVATFDMDFQQHATAGDRHDIVWGLGYRSANMEVHPGIGISFEPSSKVANLFSTFVQDEMRISDSVWFTLGAKLEHNSYSGFEVEPSVRLVWSPPTGKHAVWASASKSIRQPSLVDAAGQIDLTRFPIGTNVVGVARLFGNPHIRDEELRDYEIGYRAEIAKNLSVDVSTFLNFYHHLETLEPQSGQPVLIPGNPSQLIFPQLFENRAHAHDYGGEVSLGWTASAHWRISPGYAYLHAKLRADPTSSGSLSAHLATDFPQNMMEVRSYLNLSHKFEFDQSLYYTARLPGGSIPGHARFDVRVARRIGEATEISLTGQNLLHSRTTEYGDATGLFGAQSVRSVYATATWRFGKKTER